MTPDEDLVYEVVSVFLAHPQMSRVQEIHISHLHQKTIIDEFSSLFPLLQMYYYPGKIASLVTHTTDPATGKDTHTFTIGACVQILRQILRGAGYKVRTRTIHNNNHHDKVVVIIPPKAVVS